MVADSLTTETQKINRGGLVATTTIAGSGFIIGVPTLPTCQIQKNPGVVRTVRTTRQRKVAISYPSASNMGEEPSRIKNRHVSTFRGIVVNINT